MVFIVEDEANLREAVRYNLECEGYEVHTTPDGAIGLNMARRFSPDLNEVVVTVRVTALVEPVGYFGLFEVGAPQLSIEGAQGVEWHRYDFAEGP